MNRVSIYFYAGDFAEALRRYERGDDQTYQTHNEVARLIHDLLAVKMQVNVYSFLTPERKDEEPVAGVRVINLGAKDYSTKSLLAKAVADDPVDTIVAHFPNWELLRAVIATNSRAFAILANSYNKSGLRAVLERRKVASLLNNSRFELVSNHCLPATEQLARIGVSRKKLIAWDIPHPFDPALQTPKAFVSRRPFQVAYVGSITRAKGAADLVRAMKVLKEKGIDVHCSFAGAGEVEVDANARRKSWDIEPAVVPFCYWEQRSFQADDRS